MSAVALLWFALGCSTPRLDDRPSPDGAIFPHGDSYDSPLQHGRDAVHRGQAACAECHGIDQSTSPACDSCHPVYPHVSGWRAGSVHGADLVGEGAETDDLAACGACHDEAGLTATEAHGCTSCHASYPHGEGWAEGGAHGVYALARPDVAATCGPCHGAALDGGDAGVSCTKCHASWPHGSGWSAPESHGVAALADLGTCAGCHATGDAWDGGTVGVACSRCHAAFPHDATWRVDHIANAARYGQGVCLRCHEAGDGPETMPAICGKACHGSAR